MGRVAKVLSSLINEFFSREIKVEEKFKYNLECELYGSPGEDSTPLPDDQCLIVRRDESGQFVLVNEPITNPGEKFLYSRNLAGLIQSKIYLKNNGTIEINGNLDNLVTFADLKTAFDSFITTYNSHTHNETGSVTAIPNQQSGASIDNAKANNLKTDG